MNRVEVAGVVSEAAPMRFVTGRAIPVLDFTLAVTDARWNPETSQAEPITTWVRCHAFGDQVEQVVSAGGLEKGDSAHVVGRLSQREREVAGRTERKTHVDVLVLTVLARRRQTATDPWASG
ncbi:MAG TPA: single-stranded DNA-binding protein [Streptosporangiaceae bacterium]